MLYFHKAAKPLISRLSVAFTRPTFQRVILLITGAIVAMRQRTVTGMLGTQGHWSDFHRVLCCPLSSGVIMTAQPSNTAAARVRIADHE